MSIECNGNLTPDVASMLLIDHGWRSQDYLRTASFTLDQMFAADFQATCLHSESHKDIFDTGTCET
jgi:hypothetical protein